MSVLRAALFVRLCVPDISDAERRSHDRSDTGYSFEDLSPVAPARAVTVPTFIYQVHDDVMVTPSGAENSLGWPAC